MQPSTAPIRKPISILENERSIVSQKSPVIKRPKNATSVSSNLGKTKLRSSVTASICHRAIQNAAATKGYKTDLSLLFIVEVIGGLCKTDSVVERLECGLHISAVQIRDGAVEVCKSTGSDGELGKHALVHDHLC